MDWFDVRDFIGEKFDTMTHDEQNAAWEQCEKAIAQHEKELKQRELEFDWRHLCPPLYRATIVEQLPCRDKFDEVQKWSYGPVGLILLGASRRGRCIWKLLERLHFEGKQIIALTPMMFKLEVAKAWQDTEAAEDWISSLHHADVLFLDDLDTVKFTEAVEETIYDREELIIAQTEPAQIRIT